MSDLVGEAVVELRGDNKRLKADIRDAGKQGGKDFSKGFNDESRKSLSKGFRDSILSAGARATAVLNIAGAVGPVILAIGSAASAAAAGVTAVAGALGPALVAGGAAGAGALLAVETAALGVKIAFAGMDKAIAGDADALAKLSPPARAFATTVTALKPRLEAIRTTLQRGLFSSLAPDTRKLANTFFPALRVAARDLGNQLGDLADRGTRMVNTGPWRRDFATVARDNTRNIGLFGRAGLQLGDAFRSLLVTAQPLIHTFAAWTLQAAKGVNAAVQAGRASGQLAAFWARASTVGAQLASILGNVTVGLFNIFKIGAGSAGTGMLTNLQGMSREFRAWTASGPGIARLQEFFTQGRTNLAAMGKLLGAASKGLAGLGSGQQLAPLVDQIRTQLLPPILEFLRNANVSGALSSLVSALSAVARVFASLSASDSSMKAFSETLRLIADAALFVVQHVPGASTALSLLFTALGAGAALKLAGLGSLVRALGGAFGVMATRAAVAAGAATTETGAVTLNTLATQANRSTIGTWLGVKGLEAAAWARSTAAARLASSVLATTGGKLGAAAVGIAGVTAAAKSGGGALGFLGGAASGAMTGAALGSFIGPEGTAIGAAVGGLAGGFLGLGHAAKSSGDGAKVAAAAYANLRSTLDQVTGATTQATRALVFQDIEKTIPKLHEFGISTRDAVTAITSGGPAAARLNSQLNSQAQALTSGTAAAKKYRDSLVGGNNQQALKAANESYNSIKKNNDARLSAIDGIRKEIGLTGKAVASKQAEIAATRSFTGAIKTLPRGVVTELKAKVLNRDDIVSLTRQYDLVPKNVRTLIRENGGTPTRKMVQNIIADAKRLGATRPTTKIGETGGAKTKGTIAGVTAEAKRLAAQHPTPRISVNAGGALGVIRTVKNTIDGIHDKTVTLHVRQDGSFRTAGGTEGRASGGPVAAGRTYLVGEEGPELVTFNRNAYVLNAMTTARALAQGGGRAGKTQIRQAHTFGAAIIASLARGIAAGSSRIIPALQKVQSNLSKLHLSKNVGKEVTRLVDAYTSAGDKLKQLGTDIAAFKTDFTNTALAAVSVRGFDPVDIVSLFTQDTQREVSFLQQLAALAKAGLNKTIIGQLQQAGVAALPQVEGIIAGGKDTITALNQQTANLAAAAKTSGVAVAETMFGNGVQMAAGLIKGLKSQQSALVRQMQALARAAIAAIRRSLRMHSPSKVLTDIGALGGASLAGGFGSQEGSVESAAARLAKAAIRGTSSGGSLTRPVTPTGGAGASLGQVPSFNIHLPTGDPEAAALAVWDRLVAAGVGG